jgi:tetratricopeptide (TPR) repeat protein
VHSTIAGHGLLAEAVLETLVDTGIVEGGTRPDAAALAAVADRVDASIDPEAHARARRDLARTLASVGNLAHADRLNRQGVYLQEAGHFELAEQRYREALAIYVDKIGDDHPAVADCLVNVALALYGRQEHAEAAAVLEEGLERMLRHLPESHPKVTQTRRRLAVVRRAQRGER